MRTSISLPTLLSCALLLLLPAAAAHANGTDNRIVQDCQHSQTGALTGAYSKAQLRHALHNLPSDVLEYSGCHDAIAAAANAGSDAGGGNGTGGGGSTGGGGGSFGGTGGGTDGGSGSAATGAGGSAGTGTTPHAAPPAGAERPVEVAGVAVAPGTLPEIGQDSHRLPTPLLVLLVLIGVAILVSAALTIGRRVVARRRA